jgi:hypothetical protein
MPTIINLRRVRHSEPVNSHYSGATMRGTRSCYGFTLRECRYDPSFGKEKFFPERRRGDCPASGPAESWSGGPLRVLA